MSCFFDRKKQLIYSYQCVLSERTCIFLMQWTICWLVGLFFFVLKFRLHIPCIVRDTCPWTPTVSGCAELRWVQEVRLSTNDDISSAAVRHRSNYRQWVIKVWRCETICPFRLWEFDAALLMVQPSSECFWSGAGCRFSHFQWVRLPWGFLLVFCSNQLTIPLKCPAVGAWNRQRQTDGSQRPLAP